MHLRSCRKDLCVYTRSVTSPPVWPKILRFAFSLAPALSSKVATVWRVSWGVWFWPWIWAITLFHIADRYCEYSYGLPSVLQIKNLPGACNRLSMNGNIREWIGIMRIPDDVFDFVMRIYRCRRLILHFSRWSNSLTRMPVYSRINTVSLSAISVCFHNLLIFWRENTWCGYTGWFLPMAV